MDLSFYLIQLIGLIGLILLVLSYYRKDTNHILVFHILSTSLFCLHYYLLGAYSGLLICFYEVIRDYLYYRTDKDKYVYIGSVFVYLSSAYFTFTSILDLYPYIASLIDGFFLTQKRTIVIYGAVLTYSLWLLYDIYANSYSGIIADGIIILSNLYILVFKKENKNIIVSKTFYK